MYRHHIFIMYILIATLAAAIITIFVRDSDDRVRETLYSEIAVAEETLESSATFTDVFTDIIAEKDGVIKLSTRNVSPSATITFRLVDSLTGEAVSVEKTVTSDEPVEITPDIKEGRKFDLQYKTDQNNTLIISRISYEYKI